MSDAQPVDWNPELYTGKHAFVWQLAGSLVEMLAPQPGERILDVGCGTGELTATIAESGAEVIGLDNSPSMLDEARRQYPAMEFQQRDAHDFTCDTQFDAVFSNAALHWVTRPTEVAHCISACLKPGGRFVAEFGGKGNVQHLTHSASAASLQVIDTEIPHPWYFPDIAEFASLLKSVGLEVTQAHLFDRPVPLEGDEGLRSWLQMFGSQWLDKIPAEQNDEFFRHAEDAARSELLRDGQWYADYRRIRVVANRT